MGVHSTMPTPKRVCAPHSLLQVNSDVIVRGFCEGYHLSKEKFVELIAQFPAFRGYIINVARLRRAKTETPPAAEARRSSRHDGGWSNMGAKRLLCKAIALGGTGPVNDTQQEKSSPPRLQSAVLDGLRGRRGSGGLATRLRRLSRDDSSYAAASPGGAGAPGGGEGDGEDSRWLARPSQRASPAGEANGGATMEQDMAA